MKVQIYRLRRPQVGSLLFVHLTETEALKMIQGLVEQMRARDPNVGRAEYVGSISGERRGICEFTVAIEGLGRKESR